MGRHHRRHGSTEHLLGLLKVNVQMGVNLAVRDVRSSDPYVIVKMGSQKVKTRVVKKNTNPEWNEELTLTVDDPNLPIKVMVYDKDTFSFDDKMGDAEFCIGPFVEAQSQRTSLQEGSYPNGTVVRKVQPDRQNCYAEESCIVWKDGMIVQNMALRLRNVETGEVELQLRWVDIPGSSGLSSSS
ncbi:hypothetical protein SAY87_019713 [Trapa incisa]|uniref:C2 domain-containing protein n=1 Tax=Trapa incisa TaxID=236973 RepID=A0AAN7K2U3_9MYRT|nr:hypothetical protein SAY87_019713 [Trapa incisa]